jgi:hypothetical protein
MLTGLNRIFGFFRRQRKIQLTVVLIHVPFFGISAAYGFSRIWFQPEKKRSPLFHKMHFLSFRFPFYFILLAVAAATPPNSDTDDSSGSELVSRRQGMKVIPASPGKTFPAPKPYQSSNESDDDEDKDQVQVSTKGAAKRLRQVARIEARAANAAEPAKRQKIDEVEQEDSPKSSFDDDDEGTASDTPEAPVLRRKDGKDFSSLREREAKRQRLEANNAEGEDGADKKPAARDTPQAEDEEIQAPVLRPARASLSYHLSTLDPSARISDICQEWKYGLFGVDPLKYVDAETIQEWSANPEKQREYRTRQIIGNYVEDAMGRRNITMMEAIERIQSRWEICNNQNIHCLAIILEFQDLKRIYGDAASGLSYKMSGFKHPQNQRQQHQQRQILQQDRARARSTSVPVATSPVRASRESNPVAT